MSSTFLGKEMIKLGRAESDGRAVLKQQSDWRRECCWSCEENEEEAAGRRARGFQASESRTGLVLKRKKEDHNA